MICKLCRAVFLGSLGMRDRLRRFLAFAIVSTLLPSASLHALTWVEVAQLTHAGGSAIGESVAIDGDVAVTNDFTGVARVFVRSGGIWTEAAELSPSAVATPAEIYGAGVAIHGDTIAVGSPCVSDYCGHVYVFVRPSGGWSGKLNETARLDASAFGSFRLGNVVAFAGDSIVAGTGLSTVPNILFVFNKPGSGWSGTIGPSAFPYCTLNGSLYRVAASGDVIVAGSPDENAEEGKAFVWVKPAGGWNGFISNAAELLPSDPTDDADFGYSVGIDGTSVVIANRSVGPVHGKGYVFEMPSAGWAGTLTENAQLVGSDSVNGDYFGWDTSISGGTVVISALLGPPVPCCNMAAYGAAYVFSRPASGWSGTFSDTWEFPGPQGGTDPTDLFGQAVAISNRTIVVGSPQENVDGNVSQGVAHVFELRSPFITRTRFIEGPIRVPLGVPVEFPVEVEVLGRVQVEPTGVVLIDDGAGQECRAVLNSSGEGFCELSFPSSGTYRVRAHFLGNAEFDDSTSPPLRVMVEESSGP